MLQQFLDIFKTQNQEENLTERVVKLPRNKSPESLGHLQTQESSRDINTESPALSQKNIKTKTSLTQSTKDLVSMKNNGNVQYLINLKYKEENQQCSGPNFGFTQIQKNKQFNCQQSIDSIKRLIQETRKLNNAQDQLQSNCKQKIFIKNKQYFQHLSRKIYSLKQIRSNVIGINTKYKNFFGVQLEALYLDHTATNRPFRQIQTIIQIAKQKIANPHTQYSHFGQFSTLLMSYSEKSLLKSFHASENKYIALPAGSGASGAIEKAFKIINMLFSKEKIKPTVFLTQYQHHSNILPWVQFYDDVKVLPFDKTGILNIQKCYDAIKKCVSKKIVVSLSGASNITSYLTNLEALNSVIGQLRVFKEIIFCVDLAAFCVHHQMNLNILNQIDFCFVSPHKNLGGAESCGVLIARKSLLMLEKPTFPGGGTVSYVKGYTKEDILYSSDPFQRQISGTPPFLGFYRAALSFELLMSIGYDNIHRKQRLLTDHFLSGIEKANADLRIQNLSTKIELYGDQNFQNRANVIVLNIVDSQGNIVNYNLISLLLSDLYGIQVRSGCFCAGPFGALLLQMDEKLSKKIADQIKNGDKRKKPGFVRLDITFYLQTFQVDYLVQAIFNIAKYWKNMQQFYNLEQDGEITRKLQKDQNVEKQYSLTDLREKVRLFSYERQTQNKFAELKNRQKNLKKQLMQANERIKDPAKFLSGMLKILQGR